MAVMGYAFLFLALIASIYSAVAYAMGAGGRQAAFFKSARFSLFVAFGLVTLAVLILLQALLTHNFQLEYVASYSSRDSSLTYLLSALWAGNDGSLLFWAWVLSVCSFVLVFQKQMMGRKSGAYASAVMMVTQAFFILLLVAVANPFRELVQVPADGRGLNPMLENLGMVFHPPALLAGYAILTVPFALAVGALLAGKPGDEWLVPARKWSLFAWLLLGAGNIIGAWWAYVELGWGGYWAWDPVENAGLMPWLIVTAFLHSVMMERRKGLLRSWNVFLVIVAFNLAIFGTYLTRSGILSSVHTFEETGLSAFFVTFLAIALFGSLALFYYRKQEMRDRAAVEDLVSKEGTFQLNNMLLIGATAVVLLGTMFPAISGAFAGTKIEVGKEFFNRVMGPVFLGIILLAGICTAIGWRQDSLGNLGRRLMWPFALATVAAVVMLIAGIREWLALIALYLCSFVLLTIFQAWFLETRARHKARNEKYPTAFWQLLVSNRTRYAAYVIHLALVIMTVGIIGSSVYAQEKDVVLAKGETATIGRYTLTYNSIAQDDTPDRTVVTAYLSAFNSGHLLGELSPEKYFHRSFEQPVTEVAIRSTPVEDLYVILSGWEQDGTAAFKILVNPLVTWIWIGGTLLVLGGLAAFWPERRRVVKAAARETGEIEDEIEKRVREVRAAKNITEGGTCPKCGASHKPGARFCSQCGASL